MFPSAMLLLPLLMMLRTPEKRKQTMRHDADPDLQCFRKQNRRDATLQEKNKMLQAENEALRKAAQEAITVAAALQRPPPRMNGRAASIDEALSSRKFAGAE